jgi:hypothetical protein
MADKIGDKVVIKKIQDDLGSTPQSMTSVLRAWKEGRIGAGNAMKYLASRLLKKKKGGAVKKYSRGGGVSSGHDLTYKRK